MNLFSKILALIENLAAATVEEIEAAIVEARQTVEAVAANAKNYITEERGMPELLDEVAAGVAAIETARAELASRVPEPSEEELTTQLSELAARAAEDPEPDPEDPEEPEEPEATAAETEPLAVEEVEEEVEVEPVAETVEPEPVAASVRPTPRPTPLPRPARSRSAAPARAARVALVAAGGPEQGSEIDPLEVAEQMIKRRKQFGILAEGVSGDKLAIARADWSDGYGDRVLGQGILENGALIASVVDQDVIRHNFRERRTEQEKSGALVASGGLCAPLTPYYGLEMLSVADRPVRNALPSFNADRGGIRYARPAGLTSIGTGVGTKTVAEDAAGGTTAQKTCQVIACPPFQETDVLTIFHCLQFGNLGARAFPELVAQWNELVLAAQARVAESELLSEIDAASTQVTANSIGLGALGDLLGQILAAGAGMRSRHRMAPDSVLRIMLPAWAVPMLVSDALRAQFQRLDTDEARLIAWLRRQNLEPTFYIDSAAGRNQIFGSQAAADSLLTFPGALTWYLYPEGSFLFLDGGTLELGLVRDSVLNKTNDFQIFGESFENVAFIGIEALAVTSTVCDSGATSGVSDVSCPISY